ncbi:MAG TPA: GNAT family N-acetyltransferase [Methylocystis sp.]|nr:GNAT family N-acetyltransferase [Methylocystis sp.]
MANIRRATVADAKAIGRLHVAAWRETYVELFPKAALDSLDPAEKAESWRETIRDLDGQPPGAAFLLCDDAGEAMGFSACGLQRVKRLAALGFEGDFIALYLLRRTQRRGHGRAMIGAMASHLSGQGVCAATAWVFRDNLGACRFYEALGGKRTGIEGDWTVLGSTLPDLSYGWRDLRTLTSAASSELGAEDQ